MNVVFSVSEQHELQWTDAKVKLLIQTWSLHSDEFDKPRCKNLKIWRRIADTMNALCDNELLRLSVEDCDRKWRNLMPTYRKIMDQKKKTGRGSVHWKFLEDMLQATKDRSSVMPGADLLVSSSAAAPQSPNSSAVPVTLSTLSTVTLADAEVQTPKKKKRLPQKRRRQKLACVLYHLHGQPPERE